ncbi:MAG: ATP synthase F1 subunit delta [Thermodesulfobacteriota bacterium]|nr:ATP synthase F1 subunit delta [Thermodesulfobacteriota bacterium]
MKGDLVAKRYALALFEVGEEEAKEKRFFEELETVAEVVASNNELKSILESPLYDLPLKRRIFDNIASKAGLSEYMLRFLDILLEKDRFKYLDDILDSYHTFLDEKAGKVRVQLLTAMDIDGDMVNKIAQALSRIIGKEVVVEVEKAQSLIGGVIAEVEGIVYDGSIKTQLEKIKQSLKEG